MPELPEMRALAERVDAVLRGEVLHRVEIIGFSALRTVRPAPGALEGKTLERAASRGKYLVLDFADELRVLVHLSQAGRLDLEQPAKATHGRGALARLIFDTRALFLREYGSERRAGWWVLSREDLGPLATLGPEPGEDEFAQRIREADDSRQLHTILRDQHFGAGIGRGYADDILHRAGLSPFATLRGLTASQREELLAATNSVLAAALEAERERKGGLSEARLGERFAIHNRFGQPCPRCGAAMHRISYASREVTYCPTCQTEGRVLADRRLSRLLR